MKQMRMVVKNFELNLSKGDQSGHGSSLFGPVKDAISKHIFLCVQS